MTVSTRLPIGLALGGLAVVALAGCAPQSGGAPAQTSGGAPAAASASSGGASGATSRATSYKDGSYSAIGDYTSPGGASAVNVALTLKGGVVSSITVTPKAENPTAQQYESQFASGVGALTKGKRLSELNVTTVSGSSLTSQGFDKAIAAIEAKAAA